MAVNLAGLDKDAIGRGDVLSRPGSLRATSLLDVELVQLSSAKRLTDGARVRVHVGSAEVLGRVRLLGAGPLPPGGTALAQLRLEKPAVAGRGDRLILRSYSPASTIGGALVLDPLPPKRRAADREALARLREAPDWKAAAVLFVGEAGQAGIPASVLAARLTLPVAVVTAGLRAHDAIAVMGQDPPDFVSRDALCDMEASVRAELLRFHREHPLRPGLPREELRERVFAGARSEALDLVLASLERKGEVRVLPDAVASSTHAVTLSGPEEEARKHLLDAARAAGLAGIDVGELAARGPVARPVLERVSRLLLGERGLERVGDGLVLRDHLEAFKARVRERFPPGSRLDVGAIKDMTGLSRRYVIPLLEYLDRERITRRTGGDRTVLG